MKFTKKYLQKLIKEEVQATIKEQGSAHLGPSTIKKNSAQKADDIFSLLSKLKGKERFKRWRAIFKARSEHFGSVGSKQRWQKTLAALKNRFPLSNGQTWKQFIHDDANADLDSSFKGKPRDSGVPPSPDAGVSPPPAVAEPARTGVPRPTKKKSIRNQ